MSSDRDNTTQSTPALPSRGLQLRVVTTNGTQMLPLPARGAVVIGRSEEADVRIDDRSVSRRHATLHLGERVELEDHGSANGTRVRGAPLSHGARVHVRPGDVIEFGTVLCALAGSVPEPAVAPREAPSAGEIVVVDPAMVRLHAQVDRVAGSPVHILLLGETGAGKEVFAERLHTRSPRRDKGFVKINCAAFTDTLFEAELFGYEKGAFSGAATAKAGLIEAADGGTLFLDEVGELSLPLQAKLLRVLEDGMVRRVGALKPRAVDVRVVSATNRDLESEAAAGRYRNDLYFRLNGFSLTIPPLRERTGEIAPLARHFARVASAQSGRAACSISPEAMAILVAWRWPGNIRELRNVIARAALLSSDGVIAPEHLPLDKMRPAEPPARPSGQGIASPVAAASLPPSPAASLPDDLRDALNVVERQRIVDALERCVGNQTRAAALLGISRRALVTKLEQYNLPRPRKHQGE